MTGQHDEEGYAGPAQLFSEQDSATLDVRVILRGVFQPIDGHYHWYGRLAQDDRLTDLVSSGASVVLHTPAGEAAGRLSDMDPWGRFRISGTGSPPFAVGALDPTTP